MSVIITTFSKVHQKYGHFFIVGDFNARCGDAQDYIEGVDEIEPREIIESCKINCGILNDRLVKWADLNNKLNDEQNGFRNSRSTLDHLSTLSNLIETR